MSFITGLLLIDAPASALNNLGSIPGARTDNTVGVKMIRTKEGAYPYVSAQAFRYWLRDTLQANDAWRSAPIYREEKVAYTDANPITWWDDDLLGYMRAPSKKASAVEKRQADEARAEETPTADTITRVSPFRVSTLVSLAPVNITEDFGTMSRHEGDPVPHEHQFYRATLRGLFSLDLQAAGTFSYRNKTGFRNLDENRIKLATERGLEHLESEKSYRLPQVDRLQRVSALLDGLAKLEGGAKQTLHYTDVAPPLVMLAVTKGGNHIFGHAVGANGKGQPTVKTEALDEVMRVFAEEIVSPIYIGWAQGYLDEERASFEAWATDKDNVLISHPREAYQALIAKVNENPDWLAQEAPMRVLKVVAEGVTTSFRYPHFMQQIHPTFPMPPPATIYGHIASALGEWFDPDGVKFAYHFTYAAKVKDIEHIIVLSPSSGKLKDSGDPKVLEGNVNPFDRELLFQPRLTLYLNRPEWEPAFRSPRFAVVLGRSQDLFTYTRVETVELTQAPHAYFEHTLLPYSATRYTNRGFAILLPRYLDYERKRQPAFARYFVVQERLDSEEDFLWFGTKPEQKYWIDPAAPVYKGAYRGLSFLSFVGEDDES